MDKPLLLDTFCGAGGAGMGYHLAGFEVVGVDIRKQRNYPFRFIQGNALEYIATFGHLYDAIHASPPCQGYSRAGRLAGKHRKQHPDLIAPVRELLKQTGKVYVIENVAEAPLENSIMLCGAQFGLEVYRHRFFEINPDPLLMPWHPKHQDSVPPAGRGRSAKGYMSMTAGGITGVSRAERFKAMGITWKMTLAELNESIPPAFTQYVGTWLINVLNKEKVR